MKRVDPTPFDRATPNNVLHVEGPGTDLFRKMDTESEVGSRVPRMMKEGKYDILEILFLHQT